MTSIKIKLYTHKTYKGGYHPIILQVIHNKKRRYITTGKRAKKSEWNFDKDLVGRKHSNMKGLQNRLDEIKSKADKLLLNLEAKGKPFTIDQFMTQISKKTADDDFIAFAETKIEELKQAGRNGNARVYKTFLDSFRGFISKDSIDFSEVDYKLLVKYEGYLQSEDVSVNTISNYMRTLRAIYNKAIKESVTEPELYPFREYKIKSEKTVKRALSKDIINEIRDLDLTENPHLIFARDIFMFSFYCRGMNLVDITWLQNKQIKDGRLSYRRKKTGQVFEIKLVDKAQEILDRHRKSDQPEAYIFPILRRTEKEYQDYLNFKRLINKQLKKVAEIAEIDVNLTTYVARHSWATIAKRAGISTAIISEGLGHETEETTQVYLDSFEKDVLDEANELITK